MGVELEELAMSSTGLLTAAIWAGCLCQQSRPATEERLPIIGEIDPFNPEIGTVGRFVPRKSDMYFPQFAVGEIIDVHSMIVRPVHETFRGKAIWVEGLPTDKYSDGKIIRLDDVFEVTGTKRYTTVMGATATVVFIKRYDMTKHEQLKQRLAEAERQRAATRREAANKRRAENLRRCTATIEPTHGALDKYDWFLVHLAYSGNDRLEDVPVEILDGAKAVHEVKFAKVVPGAKLKRTVPLPKGTHVTGCRVADVSSATSQPAKQTNPHTGQRR